MRAKTDMNEIRQPHYKAIADKLQKLAYPCTVVVHGPARNHRTTYRGEHPGCFTIDFCRSAEEAWNLVDCGYEGYPPDLDIYSIPGEVEKVQ